MESIWSSSCAFPERPTLTGNISAEAAVIGGGIAGILTAWFLSRKGIDTVLLERDRLCSGQTKNTTAKITAQHGPCYHRLIRLFGRDRARLYAQANQQAIKRYREIARDLNINCGFTECASCLYAVQPADLLKKEAEAAASLDIPFSLTSETELPFPVSDALRFTGQAQFHPLNFLLPLTEQLSVYEHSPVRSAEKHRLVTDSGSVTARYVIFTSHFPFINAPGYYFARMHQSRSYVLALTGAPILQDMYYGVDRDGLSFRSFPPFTLVSGGSHRTGENQSGGKYQQLERRAAELWPGSLPSARWSAQDCMTLDGLPYIGPFSDSSPGWYVATGFGKWGMTGAMVAAELICGLICGDPPESAEIFSPQRFFIPASARQALKEAVHATRGIAKELFSPPRAEAGDLSPGQGRVVSVDGKKAGVYQNDRGENLSVSVRCPHMGCQLTWNPDELSWDCPCHGSRFSSDGTLIDGPAEKDLFPL